MKKNEAVQALITLGLTKADAANMVNNELVDRARRKKEGLIKEILDSIEET